MRNPAKATDRLYLRHAYNGLVRNKAVNSALIAILILSAFLMATGSMVIERLAGSVGGLFAQAQPPHFLQMHKGEYDRSALEAFAADHDEIDAWLVTEMVGYESNALSWDRPATGESGSMSSSRFDNLFVTQNDAFDYLVDENGDIPEPAQGEVYVPVKYQQAFGLQAGDTLTVVTDEGPIVLDVQGVVKDAQMAASLNSATRVLVSDDDFEQLRQAGGLPEVIVEYRLTDGGLANDLQGAYEADEALPKNGPAITGQQIQIINTFSDGLAAMALIFVSLLLVVVALLNLRFVITGTLEDEVQEIGAMKAIGIPDRAICGLYLSKYVAMTLAACVVGGLLAIVATSYLTQSLQANYAAAEVGPWTFLVPLIALAAVFGIVVAICRRVLRKVRKIEVVNALVHGSTLNEKQTARRARRQARWVRRTGLASSSGTSLDRRLALLDLRAEGRQWVLVPVVFFLTAVLITVPANLLSTFESPQFVSSMGAPERDLRVDLQFQDEVDSVRQEVATALQGDERLADLRAYASVQYRTEGAEGVMSLPVEVGDYSGETIRFTEGGAPEEGQIALSALNASELGVGVGDTMTVERDGTSTAVEVSGLYQDLTAGGKTAKMRGEITQGASAYIFYANVVDGEDPVVIASALEEQFPTAVVFPMAEYLEQTFAGTTDAFRSAAWLALVFGIGVALLVTSLFLNLRLTRDRSKMGVLTAIGFSASEIVGQVRTKTLVTVVAGTLLGLVFAATGGESLATGLLAALQMNISDLTFIPDPWLVYALYPLLLVGAGYLGVVLLTAGIRGADKSQWLRE
ncbi:ABC transporter permease [Cellulomonas xiejunii]|uniref:FtsX-like permease family protein n=1 Tax=Cellulomonas xiejunii TaxID=2968083 RepID=A0ABY5KKN5_9CELL|nr:ABC transporter permease [Cellulomonas xiejunii]MCC2315861.1 FtsX-like permease family protein [Cellulomonas xiejunii]MCC2320788.1 FtsX-like permease family protein [Cellulomonas xiejunii]UUI71074.1 FtsX-like permease family protein [Cellulomonas xiejunii]